MRNISEAEFFKISLDGKQIASGFGKVLGDVNLFGHEQSPTLEDRQERFHAEDALCNELDEQLKTLEIYKENFNELLDKSKQDAYRRLLACIQVFSFHLIHVCCKISIVCRNVSLSTTLEDVSFIFQTHNGYI